MDHEGNKIGVVHINPLHVSRQPRLGEIRINYSNSRFFNVFSIHLTVVYTFALSVLFCTFAILQTHEQTIKPLFCSTIFAYTVLIKGKIFELHRFTAKRSKVSFEKCIVPLAFATHFFVLFVMILSHREIITKQSARMDQNVNSNRMKRSFW